MQIVNERKAKRAQTDENRTRACKMAHFFLQFLQMKKKKTNFISQTLQFVEIKSFLFYVFCFVFLKINYILSVFRNVVRSIQQQSTVYIQICGSPCHSFRLISLNAKMKRNKMQRISIYHHPVSKCAKNQHKFTGSGGHKNNRQTALVSRVEEYKICVPCFSFIFFLFSVFFFIVHSFIHSFSC